MASGTPKKITRSKTGEKQSRQLNVASLGVLQNIVYFRRNIFGPADPGQYFESLIFAVVQQEPTRAFRQRGNPESKRKSRQNPRGEHQPPVSAGRECGVDDVCNQDAQSNGQLIQGDESATEPGWGYFADVQRCSVGSHTDRYAERYAPHF